MATTDVEAPPAAAPELPDYLLDPNAVLNDTSANWRYGQPPDYSGTRKVYGESKSRKSFLKDIIYSQSYLSTQTNIKLYITNTPPAKTKNHETGSLPFLVENLVKNWEIEASFKTSISDWRTIDHSNYTFSVNGGPPQSAEHMLSVGTYNAIIAPNEFYSPEHADFSSSHKTFKRMMPAFAWEVLEVYSGPPLVAFKWRHWGEMKRDYVSLNEYEPVSPWGCFLPILI